MENINTPRNTETRQKEDIWRRRDNIVTIPLEAKNQIERETDLGLYDLEVAHLDAACGKVRNLKLDADGPLPLACSLRASHASPKTPSHAAPVLIVPLDRW